MRPPVPTTFGIVTPLTSVLVAGVILHFAAMPAMLYGGLVPEQILTNVWLYLALVGVCLVWLGVHHLVRLPMDTAAGLGVAALALAARAACDFHVWTWDLACYPYRPGELGPVIAPLVTLCRGGALVGYAFGVAMVVATSLRAIRAPAAERSRLAPWR